MNRPTRLIDLHCDWPLQYVGETTIHDPARYPGMAGCLSQVDGYLRGTSAAVIACYRDAEEWTRQADPGQALGTLITRIEAEFSGRLLIGRDDVTRWRDDADGLCWGVIGVEGFDALIRSAADLERLPALVDRGVRVFQPVYAPTSVLAGSAAEHDDRGLSDLGRAFLEVLSSLADPASGPRPIFDLAHLNPRSAADVLAWYEADDGRVARMLPVYSHGALAHDGYDAPRAISHENLARLRGLGGTVGFTPSFYATTDALRSSIEAAAALPYRGTAGYEGIAIGTDFLGVDRTLPGLGNVDGVVAWVNALFDPAAASLLLAENARALLQRAAGG